MKGWRGGPGRPSRAGEVAYLSALTDEVTPERWGIIVRRAVADAAQGNGQAREWISRYLLGDLTALTVEPVAIVTAADALALLGQAAGLILAGDVRRGQALSAVALAAVRIVETEEIEQRLTALEAVQSAGRGNNGHQQP